MHISRSRYSNPSYRNTEPGTRHIGPESRAQAKLPQTQSPRDHRSAHHLRPAVSALALTCPLPGHKPVPVWAGLREEGSAGALLGRGAGMGQGTEFLGQRHGWAPESWAEGHAAAGQQAALLGGMGSKEGESCGPTGLRGAGGAEASGSDRHVYPAPAFPLTAGLAPPC